MYSSGFGTKRPTDLGAVAVLADGENVTPTAAEALMPRIAELDAATILRAYCDRSNPNGWDKDPRFQITYLDRLSGKNSADIRLVIDAMDIAHAAVVNAIVILSTDRDFAPLAHRLRAVGLWVLGAGRAETSAHFRLACSEFHVLPSAEPKDTPRPIPIAKAPQLGQIDDAIHRVCRKHGGTRARITLMTLGIVMPREEGIYRKATSAPTWRSYLKARPDLYRIEGEGQGSSVTLLRP